MRRRLRSQAGFTLLELLMAASIIAIIAVAQVAPFQQTIRSRDHAEAAVQSASAVRLTLLRLSEELSGALHIEGARGSFVLADRTFDRPSSDLRFATTGARRVQAGARDPVEIVRYYLEPDPNQSNSMLLMKQQLPSVAAEGVEPVTMVVLEDVVRFQAEVRGQADQWAPTWEQSGDTVPRAVRLSLAVDDGVGPTTSYRTTVTLPMGERP